MKQTSSVQQPAPKQVSIAALASIYRVSEIDIARQLQNQGCSQIIEKPESIDAQALYDRLHHYQQDYLFDLSDDEGWGIATPAILDKLIVLPPEILEIPTYKRRLPWSVDLGHGTTWLYRELTACLLRDQYWEEEWRIREEHGLSRSQIAWLTINGGLPKIFLGGHAAPGWPWHFFAYSCHWKVLGQLLALGIPELDGGHLVSLQEIASIHGTSCREILELLLLDRIMCPLQDKDGLIGWPRDYVNFIVSIAAERRAGRHMRPMIHDTRKGWHVEFLEEPGHALAECERIHMTKSKN